MSPRNRNQNQSQGSRQRNQNDPPEFPLKEREYRGADGQIHHHTNDYMERHRGERQSSERGGQRQGRNRQDQGGRGR